MVEHDKKLTVWLYVVGSWVCLKTHANYISEKPSGKQAWLPDLRWNRWRTYQLKNDGKNALEEILENCTLWNWLKQKIKAAHL